MVKILHDLSSGSVSDALHAVSPHPDVNVGEASGSCRIFSTRACRPFGSSGLNIKIQGLRGRNLCQEIGAGFIVATVALRSMLMVAIISSHAAHSRVSDD